MTAPPTPCSGVYTIRSRRGPPGSRKPSTARRYAPSSSASSTSSISPASAGRVGDSALPGAVAASAISGVVRRDHLGAVGHVDLVAVVSGRVVAGGDHHAGRRAEKCLTAKAVSGVGNGRGQDPDTQARPGGDRRRRRRRTRPIGAGHPGRRRCPGPQSRLPWSSSHSRQAGGRPSHDEPVHPRRPGAERSPQPGGPERERAARNGPAARPRPRPRGARRAPPGSRGRGRPPSTPPPRRGARAGSASRRPCTVGSRRSSQPRQHAREELDQHGRGGWRRRPAPPRDRAASGSRPPPGWSRARCRGPRPRGGARRSLRASVDIPTRSAPLRAQHRHLGRRLVMGTAQAGVDALGERPVDLSVAISRRLRRVEIGEIDEAAAVAAPEVAGPLERRRTGQIEVITDQHCLPGLESRDRARRRRWSGRRRSAPAMHGGAHRMDHLGRRAPLVEMGAPDEQQDPVVDRG